MPFSPVECGCPITKTLTVNFTGSTPAPSNGYIVKWKKASSSTYTTVTPNPTSSPVTITNVPVCENINVVMQSQCDNSQVSSEQTTTINAYTSQICGNTITGSHTHSGYYVYPDYLLNVQSATSLVTLTYDVLDKANRFTVYDSNGNLIVTSGWRGVAAYSGPWGSTLSTATTGTISFTASGCYYKLVVESQTDVSYQDGFTVGISCPITGDPITPSIILVSCSSGLGQYRIEAPSGYLLKVGLSASGTLTNTSSTGSCAQLQGSLVSSTGPSANANSAIISTTGSVSIGSSNSLFVDLVMPGAGYLTINTSLITANSSASGVTGTLKIFQVNGATPNPDTITQSVCVTNSASVVSCGSLPEDKYLADVYQCGNCGAGPVDSNFAVAFPNGTPVIQGKFYLPGVGSGLEGLYVYKITSVYTGGDYALIMQNTYGNTCVLACAIIP